MEKLKSARSSYFKTQEKLIKTNEVIESSESKIKILTIEIEQARRALGAAEKQNFLGEISEFDLTKLNEAYENLKKELQETKKTLELAISVRPDLDRRLLQLGQSIASIKHEAFRSFSETISLKLSADQRLNEQLLTAYAALVAGGSVNLTWRDFIVSIFRAPSNPELVDACDTLRKSLGLED